MAAPDLSTASTPGKVAVNTDANAQNITAGDIHPAGPDPNQLINNGTAVGGSNRLQYPADRPFYYMMMNIGVYNRTSWNVVGIINTQRTIILPLPAMIIDNQKVIYDEEPLGLVGAGVLNTIGGGGSISGGLKAIGSGALAEGVQAAGPAGQGALAAAGLSVNQFLTVMLKGPSYRQLDFVWRFSPRTHSESDTLRKIIATINDAAQPSVVGGFGTTSIAGSAFWRFPYVFQNEFFYEGNNGAQTLQYGMFGMKRCVVTNRSWNYTPMNQPSFYVSKYPESIELHLTFSELEYWLAGDYGSGLTGATTAATQRAIDAFNAAKAAVSSAVNQTTNDITNTQNPPPGTSPFGAFGG